jgi:uncharacterized protein (DUF305 family)
MQAFSRTLLLAATCTLTLGAGAGVGLGWAASRPASPAAALMPGPVDIGFAQSMNLHHQQAIGMAQLMLDGRPTPLATLARSIAAAQLLELGEMRGWLRLWGQALLPPSRSMDWMLLGKAPPSEELLQYLLDCQRAPSGMSGLATDAEVLQLRQLDGRARDAHFLKLMLAHHQGGIPMARFAAEQSSVPVVRELAARVVLEQSEEITLILRTQQAMTAAAE